MQWGHLGGRERKRTNERAKWDQRRIFRKFRAAEREGDRARDRLRCTFGVCFERSCFGGEGDCPWLVARSCHAPRLRSTERHRAVKKRTLSCASSRPPWKVSRCGPYFRAQPFRAGRFIRVGSVSLSLSESSFLCLRNFQGIVEGRFCPLRPIWHHQSQIIGRSVG